MLTLDAHHVYHWNGKVVPGVTRILGDLGLYPPYRGTAGRDLGAAVHRVTHLYDIGKLNEGRTASVLLGYLAGYKRFIKDMAPEYVSIETCLYSEEHDYAGTLDRRVRVGDEDWIIDMKCTAGNPPPCTALQLGGYEILSGAADRRFALRLRPDTYNLIEYPDSREEWLGALEKWKAKHADH